VDRKAYKFRLYPTKQQEQTLFWTLTRCRELYNAALAERKEAYRMAGKSVSYYEQKRDLPEIKAEIREEYQNIHSQVLQDVLLRLDKAFKAFFRRVKNGEEPGYPRFQGRNRYDSFTYPQGGYSVDVREKRATLTLSKIGTLKLKLHRKIEGAIKTCTIKHEAGQWYAVFSCEVEQEEPLPPVESEVGIDLGVTHFAALSDGTFIESPRYYRKGQAVLTRKQRALSRKKRGSHRREKARKQVAKAHRKVRNQRRDFHHKQARKLVQEHQVIVFEDLQLTNLVKRAKPKQDTETGPYLPNGASAKSGLTKSVLDNGLGQFVQIVMSKAACAGREVHKINPKYTSQICSECGKKGPKKDLSERVHICPHCGIVLDRDTNAAVNVHTAWKRPTVWARLCRERDDTVEAPCL
jgi:putative transposase